MILTKDVIVIGAGAAGLLCAIEAGKRSRSVLVLERAEKIGKKIRISGGGRCNFTNRFASSGNFISQNPHFCKSALARFTPQDFIALVEKHGVLYHEKKSGQLFCDASSDEIIRLLENECADAGVEIVLNCAVQEITKNGLFNIRADRGIYQTPSLIIAAGGLSIPKMGATAFAYDIAKQFGLSVIPCKPALVPFVWNPEDLTSFGELSGVSLDANVRCGKQEFRESVLFTHKGLSGPAILQISSYWEQGAPIQIDLLPDKDISDELKARKTDPAALLSRHLPKRFAAKWLDRYWPRQPQNRYSDKELNLISDRLHRWQITPARTEGYDKAEVTAGGVDTRELSSKTMECKKVSGLYFIGEAIDTTGQLGGYNFQWAWSSGFAAGQSV